MKDRARGGFAAVDAIVALTLLSITLAFCMQATVAAAKAGRVAAELRRAQALSRQALTASVSDPDAGTDGGLDWSLRIDRETVDGLPLCRKQFTAISRTGGRRYSWQALSPCPGADAPP